MHLIPYTFDEYITVLIYVGFAPFYILQLLRFPDTFSILGFSSVSSISVRISFHNKYKGTNKDLQNIHIKLKIELNESQALKTGDELRCSGRVTVPAPLVAPVVLI